jgi:hypothetical protein
VPLPLLAPLERGSDGDALTPALRMRLPPPAASVSGGVIDALLVDSVVGDDVALVEAPSGAFPPTPGVDVVFVGTAIPAILAANEPGVSGPHDARLPRSPSSRATDADTPACGAVVAPAALAAPALVTPGDEVTSRGGLGSTGDAVAAAGSAVDVAPASMGCRYIDETNPTVAFDGGAPGDLSIMRTYVKPTGVGSGDVSCDRTRFSKTSPIVARHSSPCDRQQIQSHRPQITAPTIIVSAHDSDFAQSQAKFRLCKGRRIAT